MLEQKITFIHAKIEDLLIEFRDSRVSTLCANGLVIREKNGDTSSIIRLRTGEAIRRILELSDRYEAGERL